LHHQQSMGSVDDNQLVHHHTKVLSPLEIDDVPSRRTEDQVSPQSVHDESHNVQNTSYFQSLMDDRSKLDSLPTLHNVEHSPMSAFSSIETMSDEELDEGELFAMDGKFGVNPAMETKPFSTFNIRQVKSSTIDSYEDFIGPHFDPLRVKHIHCERWIAKSNYHHKPKTLLYQHHSLRFRSEPQLANKKNVNNYDIIPFDIIETCIYCTELKLNGNKIKAFQERYFSPLIHLRELDLSQNRLTSGTLPDQIFSTMTNLVKLVLDSMGLKSLPLSMNNLRELQYLSLYSNKLTTFNLLNDAKGKPKKLWSNLSKLEYLNLGANRLNRFPSQICNCTSLELLNLSNNRIMNELPTEIEKLQNLNTLFLNGNKLSSIDIVRNIQFLVNLCHLELGHNPNIHSVAPPIYHLLRLESISLNHIPITHLNEEIGHLKNLTSLDLYGSKISELPASVVELTNLRDLDLRYCKNMKEFPTVLFGNKVHSNTVSYKSPLTKLARLTMSMTMIETVPEEISSLQSLQTLLLNDCPLLAEIGGIQNLPNLVEFDVTGCISLVEPPLEVCEQGLPAIRDYLKKQREKPSFLHQLFGSVFEKNKEVKEIEPKTPSLIEHQELKVASPVPSINNDDSDDSEEEKKSPTLGSTLISFWNKWK